ncbi:MAG: single-strand selective monofunctional uracil-DNA glycosylase, partial [bacterium]|nr:single-strand selective monofunctional uracil-DNA glycosylase [bacterium]
MGVLFRVRNRKERRSIVTIAEKLEEAASGLSDAVKGLRFSRPVAYIYNPLVYAWGSHALYIKRYGASRKKVIFVGMNPGPWGMAQSGVPFGELDAVRNWLEIEFPVGTPTIQHPKRPILGFDCTRSEVSGRRLWGLFKERFKEPGAFFKDHFVSNYCPLVFMEESGRNRTPDKLKSDEKRLLFLKCDRHLEKMIRILEPEWVVGVGKFPYKRIQEVIDKAGLDTKAAYILHPSPANPAANKDWSGAATQKLEELTIWPRN